MFSLFTEYGISIYSQKFPLSFFSTLLSSKKRSELSSLVNIAMAGTFSSDRTIAEYNDEIWRLTPDK